MKMKKKFLAKILDGRIIIIIKNNALKDFILALEGKNVIVTIEKAKDKRSLQQNALYWEWMSIIGEYVGETKEKMHLIFKRQFLYKKFPALDKDVFLNYLATQEVDATSTKKLNMREMKEYMDNVNAQAKELGIILPLPEDRFYKEC